MKRAAPFASGLVSVTFRSLAPIEIIRLVQQARLQVIEWGGDVHVPHGDLARAREVAEQMHNAGLQVAAYGSYYRAAYSEEAPSEARLSFERVLETALTLGAPVIRVWAGVEGSAEASVQMRRAVADDLVRIADMSDRVGVQVATEFHGGTLTDTNASARSLILEEASHPNLYSYWQPPTGMSEEECLAGLRQFGTQLSHLHVFNWVLGPQGKTEAYPLLEGASRWRQFFAAVAPDAPVHSIVHPRAAMLEFVPGGTPESFLRDARALISLLGELE